MERPSKLINDEFWAKLNSLILNNSEEVDCVTVVWECIFNQVKLTDDYKHFRLLLSNKSVLFKSD